MKKLITLLVCLLIVLSLAACGSQSTPAESNTTKEQTEVTQAPVAETEQVVETEQVLETTAPVETEAPTEVTEEAPAFDTGWAGNEYVMPVPAPPFNVFSVHFSEDQNMYIILDDSDYSARADYNSLAAYCDALKATGYVNVEKDVLSADDFQAELGSIGASTLFNANNAGGYRVQVYQEESTPMVWVYCP